MKCKYCGKECPGEVCEACAKIENAANGAISSAKYAKGEAQSQLDGDVRLHDKQNWNGRMFYSKYGNAGSAVSLVSGIIARVVSLVAVLFAWNFALGAAELYNTPNHPLMDSIVEKMSRDKTMMIVSLVFTFVACTVAVIFGIISIRKFVTARKAGGKPIKTLSLGLVGIVLSVISIITCFVALYYFSVGLAL